MRTIVVGVLGFLLGMLAVGYAGTRTEVDFSLFSVCVTANPLAGGVNHVTVTSGIDLDNGAPGRGFSKDVLGQLTTAQKSAAVSFFNSALTVVGTSQQIPTPTNMPTP